MSENPEAHLRISDEDRHRVAEVLRQAAGDGRIDLAELDQRLESAYAAKTYADLVPIIADLPPSGSLPVPHPDAVPAARAHRPAIVPGPRTSTGIAIMSGFDRKGPWIVPEQLNVVCFMGGANLDMREASFAAQEVVLNVTAIMGGVDVTVGPGTRVIVHGVGIMGGMAGPRDRDPDETDASSPVLRIRGVALMGGVNVTRKRPPGKRRHGDPKHGQLPE